MCGMTRAMICDPLMPIKAKNGNSDEIRACIGCNQACIGHFHKGHAISCIQYPETGRELEFTNKPRAKSSLKVVVVGGGPGGMKAASVAADRGHEVSLYEANSQLGGQARLAQLLPNRSEFGGIITNLSRELDSSGARVTTGVSLNAEKIKQLNPDVVILATGAKPLWPIDLSNEGEGQVCDAWQVLKGEVNVGSSVLIHDWKGDWIGMGVAEHLAQNGCKVRLAVNGLYAGETLQSYVRDSNAARLHDLGVKIIPYARLYGRDEDSVYLQHTVHGAAIIEEEVDTLVLAQGHTPENSLEEELNDYLGEVISIGDCQMPRTCEEAVLEGLRAAHNLG